MAKKQRWTHIGERSLAAIGIDVMGLYRTADGLIAKAIDRQKHRPACSRGCPSDYCCRLHATISAAEGVAVALWLKGMPEFSTFLLRRKERILGTARKGARVDNFGELQNARCLFYDRPRRTCRIYPVRPWTCRIFHSIDSAACRRETQLTCPSVGSYLLRQAMAIGARWGLPQWQLPIALSVLGGWTLITEGPRAADRLLQETIGEPTAYMAKLAVLQLKAGHHTGECTEADIERLAELTGESIEALRKSLHAAPAQNTAAHA